MGLFRDEQVGCPVWKLRFLTEKLMDLFYFKLPWGQGCGFHGNDRIFSKILFYGTNFCDVVLSTHWKLIETILFWVLILSDLFCYGW